MTRRSSLDRSDAIHSASRSADSATNRREAADFEVPSPVMTGISPSGSRTARLSLREVMAEMLELVAQLHEVVDLAGINERGNDTPLFFGLHRLHAADEVDDGEAAMPKADMPIDENAFRIRAAQSHRFRHLRDHVPSRLDIAIVAHPTGYAAHRVTSLARPRYCIANEVGCRRLVVLSP